MESEILCFEDNERPHLIRLHLGQDEVIAV